MYFPELLYLFDIMQIQVDYFKSELTEEGSLELGTLSMKWTAKQTTPMLTTVKYHKIWLKVFVDENRPLKNQP